MKFKAAFLWGTSSKAISYMIIDDKYEIRVKPYDVKLDSQDFHKFKSNAVIEINKFFNEIEKILRANPATRIIIEYKIVGAASPVSLHKSKMNKPGEHSKFIKDKFLEAYNLANKKNGLIKKAKSQFRKNLSNSDLEDFKMRLKGLGLFSGRKGDAYQHRLWALALHASSKKIYETELKKVTKSITQERVEQKDMKKRRTE